MTESGFLNRRRRSPVSLGAAFAIQGVILAGLLTMSPKLAPTVTKIFTAIPIPAIEIIPPPPMPQPDPKPETRLTTAKSPLVSDPPFVLPTPPEVVIDPTGPVVGAGGGTPITIETPKPEPVFVGAQVDPRYARALQPAYPGRAQREGIEGAVTVKILVGTDGRVKQVQQVSADDPAFYRATEEQALARWRFRPATRDGVPVESWRTMTVRFKMES